MMRGNDAVKLLLYVFCIYHAFSHFLADPGQMHLKTVLHFYGFYVSLTLCFPGICTSFSQDLWDFTEFYQ